MSVSPSPSDQQVVSVCGVFEAEWNAGRRPAIEDHLASVPEADRAVIFKSLLRLELRLMARRRLPVDAAAYQARFPAYAEVVEAVLQEATADATISAGGDATDRNGPPLPKTIGRFEILERLGHGAFGQVLRARDPDLEREVAIKIPLRSVLRDEPDLERFLTEARAAGNLQHPNICPVHEIGRHGPIPFIVMALIQGQSLAAMLRNRRGPIPVKQAVGIVRTLAQALQAAHERGIVHRDLKPANIMFDRERKDVVVMDFGLARRAIPGDAGRTREGTVLGSPAYMSPEQARGDLRTVGPLSDQYSLGVILYELLTGQPPFRGNVNEVLGQVLHVEPVPPGQLRPGLDAALEGICRQAMAKDPKGRFSSMADFAEALKRWQKDAPSAGGSPAPPPVTRTQGPKPENDTVAEIGQHLLTMEERQRTHTEAALTRSTGALRRLLLAIGLGVAVLAAAVAFLLLRPHQTRIDQSVTVHLHGIPFLDVEGVVFEIDGRPLASKELLEPIRLGVGKHALVIKSGSDIIEKRHFHTASGDDGGSVVVPVAEPEGEAGEFAVLKHPTTEILAAKFLPDGGRIVSAGPNSGVRVWQWADGRELEHKELQAWFAAASADGRRAVFAVPTGHLAGWPPACTMHTYDTSNWADLKRIEYDGHAGSFFSLALSRDGRRILAGEVRLHTTSPTIGLFDAEGNKAAARVPGTIACFTGDEKKILVGSGLDLLEYDADTLKPLRTFKDVHTQSIGCLACAAHADRAVFGASGSANTLRVWDVQAGTSLRTLTGHKGPITSTAISSDGKWVLSGSVDRTVRLWDADSGAELHRFTGHSAEVTAVDFSPGGRRALSAAKDGTVRVWQLPPRETGVGPH